jgi:hypothetical protein
VTTSGGMNPQGKSYNPPQGTAVYKLSPTTHLDPDGILEAANTMMAMKVAENIRLEKIAKYMRGRQDPPYTPRGASTEYRWLVRRAKDNFLPLIVNVLSQNLHIDGFRPDPSNVDGTDTIIDPMGDSGWAAFMANRMYSRQHAVHRAVIKYGCAYAVVLPGMIASLDNNTGNINPTSMPVINAYSPRTMMALYQDELTDEWPIIALSERVIHDTQQPGKAYRVVTLWDDTNVYTLVGTAGRAPAKLRWPAADDPILAGAPVVASHGMGICPVQRFTYEVDLDADTDCIGEVEPLISLQDQVNFHTFNQLLAEQFAAFKQRWVTGMVSVTDEVGRESRPFKPGVDRLWAAEDSDTKFGEFTETDLQPIIDSREATIRHMAIISQVPPYALLGSLVNLSADAMSAARDGLDRKVQELQSVLTDPWRNVFRLCSKAQGDDDGWMNLYGQIMWRDTSARSFAATIDGLGKAAQMLGVPAHELWRRIPGVTSEDISAWQASAQRESAMAAIDKVVEAALTGGVMNQGSPTADQPNQIGSAMNAGGIGMEPAAPPTPVSGQPAQPPGNAAVPPGAPGNAVPDVSKTGEPPATKPTSNDAAVKKTGKVHVPAHTRNAPS